MNTPTPTDARTTTTLRYLPGLDGLRGISVLAVIVFHHYFIGGHEVGWAGGGFLGVEVFFAVSGYLITSLLLAERRETGSISFRGFYLRRGRRLLPALWTLLAVVTAYSLLFLPDSIETLKGDVVAALFYVSNWWQIIDHRSYFQEAGRPALLKHLWSLAIEEQYYLFWPVLLSVGLRKLGRQTMVNAIIIGGIASMILCAVTVHINIDFAYYSTFTRLSGLLFGSAFAFYFAPYKIRGIPARGARVALDIVGVAGLLVLLWAFGVLHFFFKHLALGAIANGFSYPASGSESLAVFHFGFLIVDLATLAVIAAAVHPASDVGRALGCKPMKWIGVRSYSLYLWHYPIFCITRPGLDLDNFGHLHGWQLFVFRLVLTFGLADLSYRFIENPIRHGAIGRYRERLRAAHGARKQRLVRRGAVIGGSLSLVAVMLGTGLANAQPQTQAVPGIDEIAHANDNGANIDPSALQALVGTTTTTPSAITTPGTTKNGKTTPTTVKRPTNGIAQTLAIGDSVMLGSKGALQTAMPGIAVDAAVSRQFTQAIVVVQQYKKLGHLPPNIVLHLGTNGHITGGMFDQMMGVIGPGHEVYFLTARVPRRWEAEVNDTLHSSQKRWAHSHVLEWHNYAGCHDDWFVHDGFHLQPPGQRGYAAFIKAGLQGHPITKCEK